jgi:hypothetical protein
MEDRQCIEKGQVYIRREFAGCRLEAQVLIRAYELAVPTARRSVCPARTSRFGGLTSACQTGSVRIAQGA